MLDFRKTPRRQTYLTARGQWGLLIVMISVGLVIVVLTTLRQPQRWEWLWGPPADDAQPGGGSIAESVGESRLRPESSAEAGPGTINSAASQSAEKGAQGSYFPGVKAAYLKAIRDDSVSLPEEQDAWYNLLEVLRSSHQSALEKASTGQVTRAQLLKQPGLYRGKLVTLSGTIRRAEYLPLPNSEAPVQGCYRTWVQPVDSPSWPVVVYCLQLPKGFPSGADLAEDVEVTGFFFKRWAYKAHDAMWTAPALVARTLRWQKPPEMPPAGSLGNTRSVLMVTAAAVVVGVWVAVYVRGRTRRCRLPEPARPPTFDLLKDFDAAEPQSSVDKPRAD